MNSAAEMGVCSDVNSIYLSLAALFNLRLMHIAMCCTKQGRYGGYGELYQKESKTLGLIFPHYTSEFVCVIPPHSLATLFLECTLYNSFPLLPSLSCSPTDLFYGAPSKTGGVFTA